VPPPNALGNRRWAVLAVLSLASLMVMTSNTLLNTALPAMARDFEATSSTLQWIVNGYTLVLAGLLLAGGTIGDLYGRRRWLAIGIVIFGAGAAGGALSQNAEQVIVARGVQGVGAALIFPATLSIITNVFERHERSKAIGIWAGTTALGFGMGPVLGGALVDEFSWPAVFWMLVPISAVGLAALMIVPESRDPRGRKLDLPGALLATAALMVLVYGIIEGESLGWTSTEIVALFTVAAVLFVAFALVEWRAREPMLPLRFFKQRDFDGGVFSIFLVFFALMVIMFFLVQYLQIVQGRSAFNAGLQVLPMAGMMMVGAPISGILIRRTGPKFLIVLAMIVTFGGVVWLTRLDVDSSYSVVLYGLLAFGFGGGMAMAPMTDTVMAAVPVDDAGVGSAINDVMRELGAALGIAITGTVVAGLYADEVIASLSGLAPPEIVSGAADGIGIAAVISQQAGPVLGEIVREASNAAFVSAFTDGFWISAGFMLAAGVAALFLVPNRMREEQATNESVAGVSPVTAGVAQPVASMAMPFVDAEALGLVRTAPQKAPVSAFGGD
jgi:EmrB/QacA subfamily drug resistance transporter